LSMVNLQSFSAVIQRGSVPRTSRKRWFGSCSSGGVGPLNSGTSEVACIGGKLSHRLWYHFLHESALYWKDGRHQHRLHRSRHLAGYRTHVAQSGAAARRHAEGRPDCHRRYRRHGRRLPFARRPVLRFGGRWIAFEPTHIVRDLERFRGRTPQFVFISSASAYQKPVGHYLITESTPLANPFWTYSQQKIACEDRLMRALCCKHAERKRATGDDLLTAGIATRRRRRWCE